MFWKEPIPMLDGSHIVFMHPSMFKALQLTPREKWEIDYRAQRMARRGYSPCFIQAHRFG